MDLPLLFATRSVRMFAYGFLSVVLALYLAASGLAVWQIGLLLSLTLAGDAAVSLWITTRADRVGRRQMLTAGALLMAGAGITFALTSNFACLLVAGIVGVISPSGYEVGPFLAIEQAALSHVVSDSRRTALFAWYNLAGTLATALGSLAGGHLAHYWHGAGHSLLDSYRLVIIGYGVLGAVLVLLFRGLTHAVETQPADRPSTESSPVPRWGLYHSHGIVARLSALFALDAFGGGFIVQTIVAYWFNRRFGLEADVLGSIFFGANVLAALSYLAAAWVARRIGLVNTMVFTHLPSNVLLVLVPLMPNAWSAITLLLVRFSISQMDVPTRQSYTVAVVRPEERSAAAGIANMARSIGAAVSPMLAGLCLAHVTLLNVPFYLAGGLKIVYDLALYRGFRKTRPPEETRP